MFTKGNTTYSEAFGFLRHKRFNMVTLQTKENADDFNEEPFTLPLKVAVEGKTVKFGGYFIVRVKNLDYGTIKAAVIKMRYSNDDQMALILNKDSSDEGTMLYQKMQEWRDFAAEVARQATINDQRATMNNE